MHVFANKVPIEQLIRLLSLEQLWLQLVNRLINASENPKTDKITFCGGTIKGTLPPPTQNVEVSGSDARHVLGGMSTGLKCISRSMRHKGNPTSSLSFW